MGNQNLLAVPLFIYGFGFRKTKIAESLIKDMILYLIKQIVV